MTVFLPSEIVLGCPRLIALSTHSILGYFDVLHVNTSYIGFMLPLFSLGEQIAIKRKELGLTKPTLAKTARVGLSTLDALENGRMGELGYFQDHQYSHGAGAGTEAAPSKREPADA